MSDSVSAVNEQQIRDCPTPEYHRTHHYCPSCPYTSENPPKPAGWEAGFENGIRKIGVLICASGHLTAPEQIQSRDGEPRCLTCEYRDWLYAIHMAFLADEVTHELQAVLRNLSEWAGTWDEKP